MKSKVSSPWIGGLGIPNSPLTADHEFAASVTITHNLTEIIFRQDNSFENYDKAEVEKVIKDVKANKEKRLTDDSNRISSTVDPPLRRILELAREKGAGTWLTTSPIQSLGFTTTTTDFLLEMILLQ